MHDYMRFDGKAWKWYGDDRNDKAVRSGEQPALYEDRVSIMLDDGKVPSSRKQGCWLTCHNGMRDTRGQVVGDAVKKHPLIGDAGLKELDIRKYLARPGLTGRRAGTRRSRARRSKRSRRRAASST